MKEKMKKNGNAELKINDKIYILPLYEGIRNEKCLDISLLRKETGYITYDPGLINSGIAESKITFVDGEKGILLHRGYCIEDLAENCMFLEVAYLLIFGKLPNIEERKKFTNLMNQHSMVHEDMQHFFSNYPELAHPMAVFDRFHKQQNFSQNLNLPF